MQTMQVGVNFVVLLEIKIIGQKQKSGIEHSPTQPHFTVIDLSG
jgi:hypothetical protein